MKTQTRTDLLPVTIIIIVTVFAFLTMTRARAQGEITCEHVKQAAVFTGQKDPKHIARALGLKLTDAQIQEAAKCLRAERK